MVAVRTSDGVNLAYRTLGDGPLNLLFMHGWGGSGAYFDETLKRLDPMGLRAITYDLRGHGASDKLETGYALDDIAQDAFTVADDAGAEKIVVVGFSMSGKFAQYLACARPDRVIGLVLVAGCPASAIPFPSETHNDWIDRAGNHEKMMEVTRMFITQPVKPDVIERWGDDAVKVPKIVLDETLKTCLHTSFADKLDRVHAPVLVIGGVHDPIFTPDTLRQAVAAPSPMRV